MHFHALPWLTLIGACSLMISACSNADSPAPAGAGGWGPGKVYRSEEKPNARGFLDRRGIIHAHSVFSHDACDGKPADDAGTRNEACFEDLRRGMCQAGHDFVMLTDHRTSFADHEFPDVLQYDQSRGDELIERNGTPAANWGGCLDGTRTLIMAGTESGTMAVGLERHVPGDATARGDTYSAITPEAIGLIKEAGAVSLVQHTEDWTVEQLSTLPIDGFEMFNLHYDIMYVAPGELMGMLAKQKQPELLPHPDLAVAVIIKELPVYLDTWSQVLAKGVHRVTTLATDAHRNTLWQLLPDGERIDSYRRMMLAFSNHLLVRPATDGSWNDVQVKEALREGRLYGVFEFLGYAEGFDYHAVEGGTIREMGEKVSVAKGVELRVALPHVRDLDPSVAAPAISVRILRATDQSWTQVASGQGDLSYQVQEPGAYRAEIRMIPRHIAGYLGTYSAIAEEDRPWIYANPVYVAP